MNLNDPDRASEDLSKALASGNAEMIARTAATHVWPLYNSHFAVLTSTISALPSPVLERHPMLRVLHPMTRVWARTPRAFTPTVYTEDVRSKAPEEIDFLFLAQMIAYRMGGDIAAALAYSRRLEDRIIQTRVESRDRADGPLWYFHHQIGLTRLAAGDSSGALLEFATARQLGKISIQPDAERVALGSVAVTHALRGVLCEAQRALDEARQLAAPSHAHERAIDATEAAAAALIAVDAMGPDLDDALAALDAHESDESTWPIALLARCRAFLAREQPEDALEAAHLAAGAQIVQPGSFASDVIAAISISALIASGDVSRAQQVAEQSGTHGTFVRVATTRLRTHLGEFDAAAASLVALTSEPTLSPSQRAETVLLSGWVEFGRNGELDTDTALRMSRIARREDSRRQLGLMPRQLMEEVSRRIPAHAAAEFDAARAGLATFEMQSRPSLTTGELRVLNALPVYPSTVALAGGLHVSPNTIKSQLRTLYRKLGCSTKTDAVRIATSLRLLATDSRV